MENVAFKIPMFELPEMFGNAIYESTYTGDYQRKRSMNSKEDQEAAASNEDKFFRSKAVSQSLQDFNQFSKTNSISSQASTISTTQPIYKINKFGLLPVHRARKFEDENQHRSQMDPTTLEKSRNSFESQSLYNYDFPIHQRPKIPSYIKRDGYFHTNSEKNIRYLKSHNGTLIPYIPAFPSLRKPLPSIRNEESYHERDFPDNLPVSHTKGFQPTTTTSPELDRYINNIQFHQRDILPPVKNVHN